MDQGITTIDIQCRGYTTVSIDELHNLQGDNFKTLSDDDYAKIRNSITEFGFTFPIFYWQDPTGTKWIIDAHQRIKTLLRWRDEGLQIPPLPADEIMAKDKTEAKKKLLIQNARYGKITEEGLTDFLNEEDSVILIEDISDYLTIPEFELDSHDKPEKGVFDPKNTEVECPNCKTRFTV